MMTADSDTTDCPPVDPSEVAGRRFAWRKVAILGVGLIGGSIGLALRQRGLARHIVGVGRSASSLQLALRRGAITSATTELAEGVALADLVVVCTPVELVARHVDQVRRHCPPETLITDVASTKASIVRDVHCLAAQPNPHGQVAAGVYIGSHPMAGSEKGGVTFADADLFVDRAVIVTPTELSPANAIQATVDLWKSLGARVSRMTPEAHDQAVAEISHLPHLVASVLAATTSRDHLSLVGGGWLDTTRIASGDVELWRQIFTDNRERLVGRLDHFMSQLAEFRRVLVECDEPGLRRLLEAGKEIRDAVGN